MTKFQSGQTGFILCCASLGLSFFLYGLAMHQVSFGIWPQSSLTIAGLHGLAAMAAVGLLCTGWRHRRLVYGRILQHPFVLLPFAIGLVSLLLTPFQILPVRHILGAPQTGEGVIWWFDWAVLSAAALLVVRFKKGRLVLAITAGLGFITMAALVFGHAYFKTFFAPYYFPDYMALPLFCLLSVLCMVLV